MSPISFEQQNVVYGENQPEYQPLPAFRNETETISVWEFTEKERKLIAEGANLYLRQMNLSRPIQPILPTLENPFT
jgi:hypothetical protein